MTIRLWGPPQRVNVLTSGFQSSPSVARLSDGRFVVTWTDGAGGGNIMARLYDMAGVPLGGEIAVSTSASAETLARVFATGNGGFAATHRVGADVVTVWHDAAGVPLPGVNFTLAAQDPAGAAQGVGRGAVIAFAQGAEIFVKRLDAAGVQIGAVVQVNTTNAGIQGSPTIAQLSDGRYAIAWSTPSAEVRARIMNADGTFPAFTTDVVLNTNILPSLPYPRVTALQNGAFVVVWVGSGGPYPASGLDIHARIVGANGVPVGAADILAHGRTSGSQQDPEVVGLLDGGFLVLWADLVFGFTTIWAQRFDAFGDRVGGEVQVSTIGDAYASQIAVSGALLPDGRVAVTFWGTGAPGDPDLGVQLQIIDPRDGFVRGTINADTLYGGDFDDQIVANEGNDTIYAQAGNDLIYGGAGNDLAFGFLGGDSLYGSEGNDTLNGGTGDDQIVGETGDDTLIGELGDDLLIGGEGNDTLNASAGQDALYGGFGNDVMLGENGDDAFFGDEGDDTAFAGAGNDVANGEGGGDSLLGEDGDDLLNGGTGGDALNGGAGVDNLMGGADGDVLIGGAGGDRLEGGTGNDIYWYQATTDGNDLIVGFSSADDQLQFSATPFGFSAGAGLTPGFNFINGPAPTSAVATFYYTFGSLFFDPDGTGGQAAVFIAALQGAPALTAGDFQFV